VTTINEYHFNLPLQSDSELRLFVEKAFGVRIPDVQVCEHHTTPWRAFSDAYFARSPITVWKASRGFGGKSFLLALLGLVEAVTLKASVSVLGGSGEQSANVLKYCKDFWNFENAPRALLAGDVQRETRLAWGNTIKALTASQTSVRGPHRPRLRLDEIDEMSIEIFDAAMGQTMAVVEDGEIIIPAQTVASSTHQNADGTMTEVLKRAAERGHPVYQWCYKETSAAGGWLLPSEIERKRGEVTAVMWETEYDLQEPSPESRAIQPDKVTAMFKSEQLGTFKGTNGEYIEIEAPCVVCQACGYEQPEGEKCRQCNAKTQKARYATGADWAKKHDWTVIITLRCDVSPVRVVAFERCGRMPWPVMIGKYEKQIKRFGSQGVHDGTGVGDVVDDNLTVHAEPFLMVGRARSDLLSNYISAIEDDGIEAPDIEFMRNEHKLASVDDVYGRGHLPDSICAGALAWSKRRRVRLVH
jgi:hypothetical protein